MSSSLRPHGLKDSRLPCPSLSPRVCSNFCPLSQWCYLTISSSDAPFSFCLQSFPASGSFPMSQFFASGRWSIRASASASVLPMGIQAWFPLRLTTWISFQSKGLSRVFSSTIFWKHKFLVLCLLYGPFAGNVQKVSAVTKMNFSEVYLTCPGSVTVIFLLIWSLFGFLCLIQSNIVIWTSSMLILFII